MFASNFSFRYSCAKYYDLYKNEVTKVENLTITCEFPGGHWSVSEEEFNQLYDCRSKIFQK